MPRCSAFLKNGYQCKKMSKEKYCHVHINNKNENLKNEIRDRQIQMRDIFLRSLKESK